MKVAPNKVPTPSEIRDQADEWYRRQVETLSRSHGSSWPEHREWVEQFLKEELRQRLRELGWAPKA